MFGLALNSIWLGRRVPWVIWLVLFLFTWEQRKCEALDEDYETSDEDYETPDEDYKTSAED